MANPNFSLLTQIHPDRIMADIDEFATIGACSDGGVSRMAFSLEDQLARRLLMRLMKEAGLRVTRDSVGNIIGSIPGTEPERPAILTGSHLDTVPRGGKFDGVVGVSAGLECARVLAENQVRLRSRLEVICFVMEESSRFGAGYGFGSRVMVGKPIADDELWKRDDSHQTLSSAVQELKAAETGQSIDLPDEAALFAQTQSDILASRRDLAKLGAYLELHIEQGPVLESVRKRIGILTAVAAPTRLRVIFHGEQNHSGTTPMGRQYRHDALAAACEATTAIEKICEKNAPR